MAISKEALLAAGGDVLLFRRPELYHMTALVNRHTKASVRFVAGLSLVYPMTTTDLGEWLNGTSTTGWEWSELDGWVSASQLRRAPPLGHLFAYLLASNFLVPMRIPLPIM